MQDFSAFLAGADPFLILIFLLLLIIILLQIRTILMEKAKDEQGNDHPQNLLPDKQAAPPKDENTSVPLKISVEEKTSILKEGNYNALKNGSAGSEYKVVLPENFKLPLAGLDQIEGLSFDEKSRTIIGTPKNQGTFLLKVHEIVPKYLKIQIFPNPQKMWKNNPSNQNSPDAKPDYEIDSITIESTRKKVIGASQRGLSHAHKGSYRDDHFKITNSREWVIMAVADGAGSAKLSRIGSKIACETAIAELKDALLEQEESIIKSVLKLNNAEDEKTRGSANQEISQHLYLLPKAAYAAHRKIKEIAKQRNLAIRNFHTTLLLTICKKIEGKYLVASFSIGDGISAIYREKQETTLLSTPDSGEQAGQTYFLTEERHFKDSNSLYKRVKCLIIDDFTAIMSMTDGVSDPIFEHDSHMKKQEKWDDLWVVLKEQAHIEDTKYPENSLRKWLEDFYVKGHNDDRTITLIY